MRGTRDEVAAGVGRRAWAAFAEAEQWRVPELLFWGLAVAAFFLFPTRLLLLTDIVILALFALSLDLILGYAGIVSLGHGALFGFGAYIAGLFAIHVTGDPLIGLAAAGLGAGLLGFASGFLVLRGADLTRLMVTLGVAMILLEVANRWSGLTGGSDGLSGIRMDPLLGLFRFDFFGRTAFLYSLAVLFVLFAIARLAVHSPFGLSLRAIRGNRLRAASLGVPTGRRLVAVYTLAAFYAGVAGGLLAQTSQFVSLDVLSFHRSAEVLLVLILGGTGYLYGGLIGAIVFRVMQDILSGLTPQFWEFWVGLLLVLIVLVGRDRFGRLRDRLLAPFTRSGGPARR